jgi:hypothetical protein
MNLDLLLEAERRGILPADKAQLLAEARRRGLVPGGAPAAPTNTNPGVSPEAPPDMFLNPQTGQYTSRELLTNHMMQNETAPTTATGATIMGAGRGATLGGIDEISGYLNSVVPGQGTMAERNTFGREYARAAEEAGRQSNPDDMLTSEIAGAVSVPVTAPLQAMSLPWRIGGGILSGAAMGATYGGLTGEGQSDRIEGVQDGAILGGIVGGGAPLVGAGFQKVADARATRRAEQAFTSAAPSVDDLVAQAGKLYDDAALRGITASGDDTTRVADRTARTLVDEGLTGPSGKIADAYPNAAGNQALLMDFAESTMNPRQMQTVRQQLAETARKGGSEGRIGSMMLNGFDETMEPLAPQIKQGNAIYARAMKADQLDELRRLAEIDAGTNYTQAGLEQALRRRFSNLLKEIEKGTAQGWTPDEVQAIRNVALGTGVENTARAVGRASPSGIVNIGIGGGMPYLIGNSIGGPVVGAAMGLGTLAAGAVGRRLATDMQKNAVEIAKAIAATGQVPPKALASPAVRQITETLMRRAGVTAPQ